MAYFAEVQFHIDDRLFHRFFDWMFRYLRDREDIERWQAVIIYPTRTIETKYKLAYEVFSLVRKCSGYLDEFFASSPSSAISIEESLALKILELIIEKEETVLASAKNLIGRVSRELADEDLAWEMLKYIETVVSCKLRLFVKKDLEAMLYTETDVKPPLSFDEFFKQKSIKQCKQEAIEKGLLELVPRLLTLGLTVEQLAEILELTVEQVRQAANTSPEAATLMEVELP
ncbi:MAG: DUF2887 domain-containing protein [Hormoscilla sp. GUM202]|nr:DUF2887 domain-containing protein [Hormoscilla sp. GUM202]